MTGSAESAALTALDAFLKRLHRSAVDAKIAEVVVDMRKLEFMNSSCFKVFVSWLGSVQDLDAAKQYRIHLLSNPNLHWQRRSLAALSCFAVDLVTIST